MRKAHPVDRIFLILTLLLAGVGFFIFSSAALGLVSREGASFTLVVGKQLAILLGGLVLGVAVSKVNYKFWRHHALALGILSIIATILVFVPGVGVSAGGARRWLNILGYSFQPAELLKFGGMVYLAAWFSRFKDRSVPFWSGIVPLIIWLAIAGTLLLLQPDTDTFGVIVLGSLGMYFIAGGRLRDLAILALIGVLGFAYLVSTKPYLERRLTSFFHPTEDLRGGSYQVNQSLIAIGSGGIVGRGFGQSAQKFYYLPEPIGDSIFAVAGEEFGLIGTVTLVTLFLLWALWGIKIASLAPDQFSRLLVAGLVITITSQSFINIASMIGLIPLAGTTLIFVSHGGSALLLSLVEAGIILNVSRYQT